MGKDNKPKDLGVHRMCDRHKEYVKECPKCNIIARIEEHKKDQKGIIVQVPVYRKTIKTSNKYTTKKGEKYVS